MAKKKNNKQYVRCYKTLIDDLLESDKTFRLATRGITSLMHLPKTLDTIEVINDALKPYSDKPESKDRLSKEAAEEYAKFAETQIKEGFPLLVSQTLISQWSFLEATINDSIIHWLKATKFKTITDDLKSLKVSFSDIHVSSNAEKAASLIRAFEREKLQKKDAVKRFEMLMIAVGWKKGGAEYEEFLSDEKISDKDFEKKLYELSKIRNLLLHKAGIVDKKFKSDCPWRKDRLNQKIKIKPKDYSDFNSAMMIYLTGIVNRIIDCEREHGMRK